MAVVCGTKFLLDQSIARLWGRFSLPLLRRQAAWIRLPRAALRLLGRVERPLAVISTSSWAPLELGWPETWPCVTLNPTSPQTSRYDRPSRSGLPLITVKLSLYLIKHATMMSVEVRLRYALELGGGKFFSLTPRPICPCDKEPPPPPVALLAPHANLIPLSQSCSCTIGTILTELSHLNQPQW
jgi:hypothetical protein